jgi:divinyl chlorophyllide a 8-vinyl-reductase
MSPPKSLRVFMLGATGTIGRATVRALVQQGHEVVCFGRPPRTSSSVPAAPPAPPAGVIVRMGDVADPGSLAHDGFKGEHFDAVVSCMASHLHLLEAAKHVGVPHMVLLSAICVQKPQLAFQQAKLAFERALIDSGLTWSIVRPTAFFKSLSGQVERVQNGKPFLIFGDGTLTACKPISDNDLAEFLVSCLTDPARQHRIMPIGGPGDAQTPRQQGEQLFALLGREPRFKRVPVGLLDTIIGVLSMLGRVVPPLADKAQLARIGRYYATESMLVWDDAAQRYDASATPSTGHDTLVDFYAKRLRGDATDDRGEHAVFS